MNYTFLSENPILSVILAIIIGQTIISIVTSPFRYAYFAYKNKNRAANIKAHGWPPEHLDADGDFKPEPSSDD